MDKNVIISRLEKYLLESNIKKHGYIKYDDVIELYSSYEMEEEDFDYIWEFLDRNRIVLKIDEFADSYKIEEVKPKKRKRQDIEYKITKLKQANKNIERSGLGSKAWIIVWNPVNDAWDEFGDAIEQCKEKEFLTVWNFDKDNVCPGDRFYLMIIGCRKRNGIAASGTILSYLVNDYYKDDTFAKYVYLRFEKIINYKYSPHLEEEFLKDTYSKQNWKPYNGCVELVEEYRESLYRNWCKVSGENIIIVDCDNIAFDDIDMPDDMHQILKKENLNVTGDLFLKDRTRIEALDNIISVIDRRFFYNLYRIFIKYGIPANEMGVFNNYIIEKYPYLS